MLQNKLIVANLLYKDNCVGYRLFCVSKEVGGTLDVYDVSKDIGDMYDLGLLSDRDILLIPDGKLLVSRDEIDNVYIVKDISDNTSLLDTLLDGVCVNNIIENMDSSDEEDTYEDDSDSCIDEESNTEDDFVDNIDDMYEDDDCSDNVCEDDDFNDESVDYTEEDNFIDTIDDMYYDEEEDSEEAIAINDIVAYLCSLYLKPSRLFKFKQSRGIPVNLDIEIGNELKKVSYNIGVGDIAKGIINRMKKEGYVYKSSDEFCNGITEGTFMEII